MPVPPVASLALLAGLSFFFGLAYEDFYLRSGQQRPGGIRTFPLLAIAGGGLYLLDPAHALALAAGLLVLGGWLIAFYASALAAKAEDVHTVELIAPVCNIIAYLLGPLTLAEPPWLAVGVTVASVLFLTGRERLHDLARRLELREIVTAGQFLILTGLVLPLLPDEPVTRLTTISPYKAWLALVAVSALSYGSYLLRRYVAPPGGDLWVAALGGLYSSTATTVVLARRAARDRAQLPRAQAGIILATALMYPRVLIVIAVFNLPLAAGLIRPLLALMLLGLLLAFRQYRRAGGQRGAAHAGELQRNPLELTAAALFAIAFVVISVVSSWVKSRFGAAGIDVLAAIVGFTDIDPFVLSLAQGAAAALPVVGAGAAVLIATASNNVLKAAYAAGFAGWRESLAASAALILLAAAALGAAFWLILHSG